MTNKQPSRYIGSYKRFGPPRETERDVVTRMRGYAKAHGAASVEVWSGGDEPDYEGDLESDILDHAFACDRTALVFLDDVGKRLGMFQLNIGDGGPPYEVVCDYSANSWAEALGDEVLVTTYDD